MNTKKTLFLGVLFAFFVMGFIAMQRAIPNPKEDRIYKAIKIYSPYKLEKRMGGLSIVDKRNGRKEKPSAAEVLLRMDELDKEWGKSHMKIENNDLIIMGENKQVLIKIFIETEKERKFIQTFYGI